MKKHFINCCLLLILTVSLLCVGCSKLKATTIQLKKTEGTVAIADDKGKNIEPAENLMIYSGYDMSTRTSSYAWLNLDQVKLAKMDEESQIKIQKNKKDLDIRINSGGLFFHVTEPLAEDETMNIRTSTIAVGIRGTCGWVTSQDDRHSRVSILEGEVSVTTSDDETISLSAGETAEITLEENGTCSLTITRFTSEQIPDFVRPELEEDDTLASEILEASGIDIHETAPEEENGESEGNEPGQEEGGSENSDSREAGDGMAENSGTEDSQDIHRFLGVYARDFGNYYYALILSLTEDTNLLYYAVGNERHGGWMSMSYDSYTIDGSELKCLREDGMTDIFVLNENGSITATFADIDFNNGTYEASDESILEPTEEYPQSQMPDNPAGFFQMSVYPAFCHPQCQKARRFPGGPLFCPYRLILFYISPPSRPG